MLIFLPWSIFSKPIRAASLVRFFFSSGHPFVLVGTCFISVWNFVFKSFQAVLAVAAVFGDELLAGVAAFSDLVALGIVIVIVVVLHQLAVAFDVGQVCASV
ncbi:hypothetical protein GIW45_26885 [Pseudomonas congelans]|nr:hypothetical protein [Pseudomonas congelans]MCF5167554.1 hypothetical protein [Pseudomonas congelans]